MTDTLGRRIAQARREMGVRLRRDVTRGEIAKATGVDPSTVSLWESDKKSPREDTLAKLAEYLGVTPAYLRYGVVEVAVLDVSHAKPVSAAGKARARVVRDRNEKSQPTVKATRKRKGGAA